ncbi:CCA tRNA nucleotidyltransferase [Psychromarinibacter sp. C21-152]|uniref:CCA tRNA nucleotidyltransferase n=1 Tax=Psychromarinibacter sediminicola TaxID=3033385 RepID=A0AAE3T8J7_9RHOB|nr:CCA tRNA nucleotidyltransferase [Psychromarinibacter sediminicola]MDF0601327.1 CCA tRNA nucleotidyltransferase [Psychromarinibacter sediminicola]
MRVTGDWLTDPRAQAVCRVLTDAGYEALFVGGCVRNALIGAPVDDIDISTDATPETVSDLAEKAGLKAVPTGIDHGTVTVVAEGQPHEITTFRRDVETDGRRAVVAFTTEIREDALRRDLTMNALYARPDGTVVDPLGGLPDLLARRVRFIEDPEARIREDYLRILRFFRFHAWYGDPQEGLDADGLAACAALSDGLETLSKERIGAELRKLLAAPDPSPSAAAMQHAGCLRPVLPGADTRALPILVALEPELAARPEAIRRLAVLGGEEAAGHLRLSKKDARRLERLRAAATVDMGPAELGYRLGLAEARDAVLIRAALMESPLPPDAAGDIARGAEAEFPVTAKDLMPDYKGAALGERLTSLETRWIASGFTLTRDELVGR